jgi:hypothetical protein
MIQYFIHDGQAQKGPFSYEDLSKQGIGRKTMIWREGLEGWSEAEKLEELKDLLKATPPPFEKQGPFKETFEKAKKVADTDIVEEIEKGIPNKTGKWIFKLSLVVFSLIGIIYLYKSISSFDGPSKSKISKDLILKDANFDKYNGWYSDERGFTTFYGKVSNTSKDVTYKDVVFEMEFFTQTKTSLGKREVLVYKTFAPNKTNVGDYSYTEFSTDMKEELPEGTYLPNTVVKIIDAKVYEEKE